MKASGSCKIQVLTDQFLGESYECFDIEINQIAFRAHLPEIKQKT